MKVKLLRVGPIGTNCYILEDDQTNLAAVIDPGDTFFLTFFTLWLKYLVKQCVTGCIFFKETLKGEIRYTLLYIL